MQPNSVAPEAMFDATYYATGLGAAYSREDHWLRLFDKFASHIVTDIAPTTVMDAGCAFGFLVESLRKLGVAAWGVDISPYAIAQADASVREFCAVGSIAEPLPFAPRFDLIVCIEIVEHMPPAQGEQAIVNLCTHADDVLFSSSPNDFTEPTHFNVRPVEYWAGLFARQGFLRDLNFDASFITPWAARYRKRTEPQHRIVTDYERFATRLSEENGQLRIALNTARYDAGLQQHRLEILSGERDALRQRVDAFEHGKFIRFMRWLRGTQGSDAQ